MIHVILDIIQRKEINKQMKIEISIGTENEEEWDHWCYCDTIDEAIFLLQKLKIQELRENEI